MIDLSVPLAGLSRAETSLNRAASNIARAGLSDSGGTDTVDLSAEMIALIQARNNYAVNLAVAHVEDQVSKSLVNLLG